MYDTGGMRRTHLRGHANILKRVLVHASGFNLGLVMRRLIGVGTPRGLQGRLAALVGCLIAGFGRLPGLLRAIVTPDQLDHSDLKLEPLMPLPYLRVENGPCTTGC